MFVFSHIYLKKIRVYFVFWFKDFFLLKNKLKYFLHENCKKI